MSGEVRPVEEIRADLAATHGPVTLDQWYPARLRLAADVEPLLARLAAADRDTNEQRIWRIAAEETIEQLRHERDDARTQLAAAQAENTDLRRDVASLTEQIAATDARVLELVGQVGEARALVISLAVEDDPEQIARFRQRFPSARTFDAALPAAPQPEPDSAERQAMEADAMREPSPSAMLAGIHVTRYQPQDCACRGKHEHRYGYTRDCTVRDCTCSGSPEPPASDEPARCEHGETIGHKHWPKRWENDGQTAYDCPGPAASGTPDGGQR